MEISEENYRLSKFCEALSNAVRLKLVLLIRESSQHVKSLADKMNRDRSTISRHLNKLSDHNLVRSKTRGRKNIYSLKKPDLIEQFLKIKPYLQR